MLAPLAKGLRVSAPLRYYLALALLLSCTTVVATALGWEVERETPYLRVGGFRIVLIVLLVQLAFFIGASILKNLIVRGVLPLRPRAFAADKKVQTDSNADSDTDSDADSGTDSEAEKNKKLNMDKAASSNKDLLSRMEELDRISKSLIPRLRELDRVVNRIKELEAVETRIKVLEKINEPFADFFRLEGGECDVVLTGRS